MGHRCLFLDEPEYQMTSKRASVTATVHPDSSPCVKQNERSFKFVTYYRPRPDSAEKSDYRVKRVGRRVQSQGGLFVMMRKKQGQSDVDFEVLKPERSSRIRNGVVIARAEMTDLPAHWALTPPPCMLATCPAHVLPVQVVTNVLRQTPFASNPPVSMSLPYGAVSSR